MWDAPNIYVFVWIVYLFTKDIIDIVFLWIARRAIATESARNVKQLICDGITRLSLVCKHKVNTLNVIAVSSQG